MKAEDIRQLKDIELHDRVEELTEEIWNLNFRATTEPLQDPGRVRRIRKDIARMKTILRARELGIETEPGTEE